MLNRWDAKNDAIKWLVEYLDYGPFLVLVIFAVLSHSFARHFVGKIQWREPAKFLSFCFFVACAQHFVRANDGLWDVPGLIGSLLRAGLLSVILHNVVTLPVFSFIHFLMCYVESEWYHARDYARQLTDEHKRRPRNKRPVELPPPPAPPPPRDVRMRSEAEQARIDFEFECEIIRSGGLDQDEQEAAITEARQKYLRRLQTIMQ